MDLCLVLASVLGARLCLGGEPGLDRKTVVKMTRERGQGSEPIPPWPFYNKRDLRGGRPPAGAHLAAAWLTSQNFEIERLEN